MESTPKTKSNPWHPTVSRYSFPISKCKSIVYISYMHVSTSGWIRVKYNSLREVTVLYTYFFIFDTIACIKGDLQWNQSRQWSMKHNLISILKRDSYMSLCWLIIELFFLPSLLIFGSNVSTPQGSRRHTNFRQAMLKYYALPNGAEWFCLYSYSDTLFYETS